MARIWCVFSFGGCRPYNAPPWWRASSNWSAGLIHVIARALGGRGNLTGYVKLLGYAALVGVTALPVALLDAIAKLQGNARLDVSLGQLAGLLTLVIFLWQNVLLVFAARLHY